MAKVLYSAYTAEGNRESGFIDVSSNYEALRILKEKGLREIEFHDDALFSSMQSNLEQLSDKELKEIAQLEIQWQKEASFGSYLKELLRVNMWAIAIGVGMMVYGYSVQGAWWMSFGVILATIGPFFGLWNYKLLTTYEALIKSTTFGEWDKVYDYANRLKASTKKTELHIEADSKIATALAAQGELAKALAQIADHRKILEEKMPGMYESKIATLYYLAGDYRQAYLYMKKAYEISDSEIMALDYISAEALYGNLQQAKQTLQKVDVAILPAYAKPYHRYLSGLIAYKEKKYNLAYEALQEAYSDMLAYRKNPAVWIIQAQIAGLLAIVKYEAMQTPCSNTILSDGVVSILKVYAYKELQQKLQEYYPKQFER